MIEHDGRRQRLDAPRLRYRAIPVEENEKRHRAVGKKPTHGAARCGHADGNDADLLAIMPVLQLAQPSHLRPAWLAPRGEEMDENHLPAMTREVLRATLQGRQRERWPHRVLDGTQR